MILFPNNIEMMLYIIVSKLFAAKKSLPEGGRLEDVRYAGVHLRLVARVLVHLLAQKRRHELVHDDVLRQNGQKWGEMVRNRQKWGEEIVRGRK